MMNAHLLITNAAVYTVDDANPQAEAVAVTGDQISFVGSAAEAKDHIGPNTRVIDANGRTLLPGFIDSHFHLQWGSATLNAAQLYEVNSLDGLREALQTWAAENPDAPWVVGQGVSYAIPDNETPLTRHYLDEIVADRPLVLTTYDQHSMFANTAALKAAGILHGTTQHMENGEIVLDTEGIATGELYEMDAMAFIHRAQPKPNFEQQINTIKKGLALCASLGITSIHNMDGDLEQAALYAFLEDHNELTLRIYMPFWAKPHMSLERVLEEGQTLTSRYQGEMLRGGLVKFFMDGVYESYTAVTLAGYPDQPDNLGEPLWSAARFAEFATAVDALGLQIAVHACGDGAVRRVLDGYAAAQAANGPRDSRHRVEHIEMVDTADVPRFAKLGVVASMQPLHSPLRENDPDIWPTRVDAAEWDRAFAWRTLREAGATLAFGSDWPVVTADPILGLYGALNRRPWREGVNAHVQTLTEAIRSYTRDAAYAEFQEQRKGQIKTGMLADLVLLDRDLFDTPAAEIKDVKVEMTMCGGRVVFER